METIRGCPDSYNVILDITTEDIVQEVAELPTPELPLPVIAPNRLQDDIRQQGIDNNVIAQDGSWSWGES